MDAPIGADRSWSTERLAWTICTILSESADDPVLRPPTKLPESASRYSLARRVAELFARYDRIRPELIRHWAGVGSDPGIALAASAAWQPHLVRLAVEAIHEPPPAVQLAERDKADAVRWVSCARFES